jgi:hypothetical protein
MMAFGGEKVRLIYKVFILFIIIILIFSIGEFYLMQIKLVNPWDSSVTIEADFTAKNYYNMSDVEAFVNASFTGSPIIGIWNGGGGFQLHLVYIGNTTQELSQNLTSYHEINGSTISIPCYLNISNINASSLQRANCIEQGVNLTNNHLHGTSKATVFYNILAPAGYYGFKLIIYGGNSEIGSLKVVLNREYIYVQHETKGSGQPVPYLN